MTAVELPSGATVHDATYRSAMVSLQVLAEIDLHAATELADAAKGGRTAVPENLLARLVDVGLVEPRREIHRDTWAVIRAYYGETS